MVVQAGVLWGLNLVCVALLLASWVRHAGGGRSTADGFNWFVGFALAIATEPLLILAHEMAHALAGLAVGMRVFGMTLGTGPRLARSHVGAWTLEIHLIPSGGSCRAALRKTRFGRMRIMSMVAAGPAVHLVISLAIAWALTGMSMSVGTSTAAGFLWGILLLNVAMLLFNLWPHAIRRGNQTLNSDGKQLRELWRSNDATRNWLFANYVLETSACLERGSVARARVWLEHARSVNASNVAFTMNEVAVVGAEGNWPGASELALARLANESDPLARASLAAWASVSCVYAKGDLNSAESLCDESMSIVPWEGEVQAVRAVVLLAQGRNDKAEGWLRQARTSQCGWAAKAAGAHAWAELYRRKGDGPMQAVWHRRARALDPAEIFAWPTGSPRALTSDRPEATQPAPIEHVTPDLGEAGAISGITPQSRP